jgi:hypothetical protein
MAAADRRRIDVPTGKWAAVDEIVVRLLVLRAAGAKSTHSAMAYVLHNGSDQTGLIKGDEDDRGLSRVAHGFA